MKKILINAGIAINITTHSFYPMKELYRVMVLEELGKDQSKYIASKNLNIETENEDQNKCLTIMYGLIESNTSGNFLITVRPNTDFLPDRKKTIENLKNEKASNLKFLQCDFEYNFENCWNVYNNNFWYATLHWNNEDDGTLWHPFKVDGQLGSDKGFKLTKNISSNSKVKIENTGEGVFLSKGDKKIELAEALKQYYKIWVEPNELADYIAQSALPNNISSGKLLEPALNPMRRPSSARILTRKEYNLLKDSTILTVWKIVEQENENGFSANRIIGLARGKDTKLFHWTAKLDEDIEILMQYAD